ncbi:hypothetical protein QAA18_11775 [Luteimonas sp. 8-5]|uniref:hypothetical protein n=1 Tax=Luteimonas sp. 8-5 TaxID=3039387 RepID=UPI0024362F98|nr:hypothetical protein [Luteimonas sp. 8-5]MDG6349403.1 hypothetical protein [Luteimonas sp. 8-5]
MTRQGFAWFVPVLALGLQACCSEQAAAAPDPASMAELEIVAWGPQRTVAGTPFNRQAGGQSALWIRLDRRIDGHAVLVAFGDAYLEGDVSGDTVTAVVPEASYASAGAQAVGVVARRGQVVSRSNEVAFIVDGLAQADPARPRGP